jgi:predicted secreted protein
MRKLCILTLLLILCFAVSSLVVLVHCDPSWIQWSQTYGGTNADGEHHRVYLVEVSDGGFVLAGNTESLGAGSTDIWLIKVDGSGIMEWNHTYGGPGLENPISLIQTSDGGFMVTGSTLPLGPEERDFWLVKTDSFGNLEWNKTYGGVGSDWGRSVIETSDGGYILVGDTTSFGAGGSDYWLVKTDENGNMQWNRTYGGSDQEIPYDMIETSDKGFVIVGKTSSFGAGGSDCWLIKVDSLGYVEWNQTFGGGKNDSAESLVQTSDGGFAFVGVTESFASGWTECWLIKTDSFGNMVWNRTYGEDNDDWGHSLIVTSDGGFAFAGETSSFGAGNYDFWLVKTDIQGIPEFTLWAPLLIMIVAIVVVILVYRYNLKKHNRG